MSKPNQNATNQTNNVDVNAVAKDFETELQSGSDGPSPKLQKEMDSLDEAQTEQVLDKVTTDLGIGA